LDQSFEAQESLSALMSLDTRGIDPQRLLPQSLEDRLLGWFARLGALVLLGVIGFVWISLATWSNTDPSLTHATTIAPRNWMGAIGAILADLMLQTIGFAAVIALIAPGVWTLNLLRDRRVDTARTKVGFYPLAVLAAAGALSTFPVPGAWPLNHGLGGVLGDGLFRLIERVFALINADRAGLVAALLLNISAAMTFAKSIGLDLRTLSASLFQPATVPSILDAFSSISDTAAKELSKERSWRRRWSGRSASPTAKPVTESLYGAAAELAVPEPLPPPHQWTRDHSVPHLQAYTAVTPAVPMTPSQLATPAVHSHPPAQHSYAPAFDGPAHMKRSSLDDDGRVTPPFDALAARSPPATDDFAFGSTIPRDDAQFAREPAFDANTDTASRAIAARFAPDPLESGQPIAELKAALAAKAASLLSGDRRPIKSPLSGLLGKKEGPEWVRPSLNLLKRPSATKPSPEFSQTVLRGNARLLEDVLADFSVKGEVKDIKPGPVVTLFELEPSRGTKSSRVIGLADDIARSMSVVSVRAAVVPGRNAIGLELPNARREPVLLREILEADVYKTGEHSLPMALGKSIGGEPVVADLARMPHLLVAGTTGSGKSVGVNAMVLSLLYRHAPEDCRMIMIDPKMLELSVYNGIPHLLTPVVTDPHKAVAALNWAVGEMEERYKRMASLSVRNIDMFNNRVRNAKKRGEILARTVQTGFDKAGQAVFEKQKMDLEPLPHIVIVVDEFADLMSVAGKDVEVVVQRLAQMARAAGIHMIMATQRPSVDVITGTIKANFPTRISFKVTSKIDSRTILNEQGAEQLLGQGDMLFSSGSGQIVRVHGAFVSDEEVEAVANALRRQGPPNYVDGIAEGPAQSEIASGERAPSEGDLYDRAVAIVLRDRKASTSYIQRRLSIGYNRAADIIERMEREGIVSPANAVGKRDILISEGGGSTAAA
jgi:DNA segregation ATPase FtsK/SpoIIIE, S-DNA-T family